MSYLPAGSVIDHRRDTMPSNGDHLDIRIVPRYGDNSGQHINPALRPGLLSRVYIGEGDNLRSLTSYPLTSGYGPRDTGIPGASKFHKGHDYGIAAGMPISVQGGNQYWSENGVGIVSLTDDEGNPYELEFYHTDVAPGSPERAITPEPQRVEAKTRAKSYSEMTGAEMNAKYDELRSGDIAVAETEGMKMHKTIFGKP